MPRAITLKPLTDTARLNTQVPSNANNPPSSTDIVRSVALKHDMIDLLATGRATKDDVLACIDYERAVLAAREGPPDIPSSSQQSGDAPSWFFPAMSTALGNALDPIKEDIKSLKDDVNALKGDMKTVKADVNALKGDMKTVKADINGLKGNVNAIKGDVSALKGDVSALKGDVSTLKADVSALKGDVSALKDDINTIKDDMKTLRNDIKTDMEAMSTLQRKNLRIAALAFNRLQPRGENTPFEPVPNENGADLPSTLPPLASRKVIRAITLQQQKEWLQYYNPQHRPATSRNQERNTEDLIFFIGAMKDF